MNIFNKSRTIIFGSNKTRNNPSKYKLIILINRRSIFFFTKLNHRGHFSVRPGNRRAYFVMIHSRLFLVLTVEKRWFQMSGDCELLPLSHAREKYFINRTTGTSVLGICSIIILIASSRWINGIRSNAINLFIQNFKLQFLEYNNFDPKHETLWEMKPTSFTRSKQVF